MSKSEKIPASVQTACPYCGVGCGVLAEPKPDGSVTISGDPAHPANRGRLCSKGSALGETLSLDGRLPYPEIHGRRAGWDAALDLVARKFGEAIAQHGPDSVAFYVSGQLLTEDYYVANKLMKGFLGSANIDTNSRLCMASSVAGHKRAFGADTVPGCYEDLELAELVVLVGSNAAWCHPVLYQRLARAKESNPKMKLVLIDPRRTASAEIADLHLAIAPGTDVWLWNGLLAYLFQNGILDYAFLENHTQGYGAALAAARASAPTIPATARACGLADEDVARFFHLFARTEKTVTLFSQGVNQSSSGTDKVNAIINCHLATGRIGRPGMAPFSLTGQPNAMGGREVGALANQLAAHMSLESAADRERVQRFWNGPAMATRPGLKAVDLFRAVEAGQIKALWIMATNPAVSLPDAGQVRRALAQCEFVVVSDCVRATDTTQYAHVLLPALAWGEKEGTVTNSERRISRQRVFLARPGEAKPDWWIVSQVARCMGFGKAFDYRSAADVFREYAALSGFENDGTRDFDIGALSRLSEDEYAALAPVQWPVPAGSSTGRARFFDDGKFFTPSGKAQFVALDPRPPVHAVDEDFPFALNTGRVRDHWHTMTRTGKSPRLSQHTPEPYGELHPQDAEKLGVRAGDLIRVESRWGEAIVRARVSRDQLAGSVFLPMHWNGQFASHGLADAVVNPVVDPLSGQPEFKHTPVRVSLYRPAWHGFALSRRPLDLQGGAFLVRVNGNRFVRYELAGDNTPDDWPVWARAWLAQESGEWLDYFDAAAGRYRVAWLRDGRFEACFFAGPEPVAAEREWLAALFAHEVLSPNDRMSLLAGRPPRGQAQTGRTVCACFGVGENTIVEAIRT
ncbi:MAG: molybdopterin-dependent oxidoreductase, partial [Bacteroidota bacterium]